MNDVCKASTIDKLISAMKREGLSPKETSAILGVRANYISAMKNPKLWHAVPAYAWERVLEWTNSGYSVREYPKHKREQSMMVLGEIVPVADQLWNQSVENVKRENKEKIDLKAEPSRDEEITEVDFEETPPIDEVPPPVDVKEEMKLDDPINVHQDHVETALGFIRSLSTRIILEDGEVFHYLPFWFRELGDNKFEIINFDKLPERLRKAIIQLRKI